MTDDLDLITNFGPKKNSSIIKVIGVGGGGGNAVKHMYSEGIKGVDYLICNTDKTALEGNPVPSQLILGETGLGAGASPDKGRELAEESAEALKKFIGSETKMLFVTAGMGKGTGTGASPVVARIAREMGILTIGVVTAPFNFEGKKTLEKAEKGIANLRESVDSIIIVQNENLIKHFEKMSMSKAYSVADDVLKIAVKCIAELVHVMLDQNIDFNDVKSIMENSGTAMLGLAEANGENRVEEVYTNALSCPLLQEEEIRNAKNLLFCIAYGPEHELDMEEFHLLTSKFEAIQGEDANVIWGQTLDHQLGDKVKLSVIITGFNTATQTEAAAARPTPYERPTEPITTYPPVSGNTGYQQTQQQIPQQPLEYAHTPYTPPQYREQNQQYNQNQYAENQYSQNIPSQNTTPQYTPPQYTPPVDPFAEMGSTSSPQLVSRDNTYDDNKRFEEMINTPAIAVEQLNQTRETTIRDNFENQNKYQKEEDDLHNYFKSMPD